MTHYVGGTPSSHSMEKYFSSLFKRYSCFETQKSKRLMTAQLLRWGADGAEVLTQHSTPRTVVKEDPCPEQDDRAPT